MKVVLLSLAAEFPRRRGPKVILASPAQEARRREGTQIQAQPILDPGRGTRPGAFQEAP